MYPFFTPTCYVFISSAPILSSHLCKRSNATHYVTGFTITPLDTPTRALNISPTEKAPFDANFSLVDLLISGNPRHQAVCGKFTKALW